MQLQITSASFRLRDGKMTTILNASQYDRCGCYGPTDHGQWTIKFTRRCLLLVKFKLPSAIANITRDLFVVYRLSSSFTFPMLANVDRLVPRSRLLKPKLNVFTPSECFLDSWRWHHTFDSFHSST